MKPFRKMIPFGGDTGRPGRFMLVKETGSHTDQITAAILSLRKHLLLSVC